MDIVYDEKIKDYIYISSKPKWKVKNVEAKNDYTMIITFEDDVKKIYDAKELIFKDIYKQLNDIDFFLTARVFGDSVIWNDEIDIAPEFLYENSVEI